MATKRAASTHGSADKARRIAAKHRKLRLHAEALIEQYLRVAGFKEPSDLKDGGAYHLDTGEVEGFATVRTLEGDLVYTVAAEVLPLPSDKDLVVPLMRELLEINSWARGPVRLAIVGDSVWAGISDLVELMPDDDFGRYISATLGLAEGLAGDLTKKYGKTSRKRKA
jgi:hypothetical protein